MLNPAEVFKPGQNEPNDMYISRLGLEKQIDMTFEDDRVSLLLGTSGSGKSWLYKHGFQRNKVEYATIPVSRDTDVSLAREFEMKLAEYGDMRISGRDKTNEVSFFAKLFGFRKRQSENLSAREDDPLYALINIIRKRAGIDGNACLVIENAEQAIHKPGFLSDLSDLIVSMNEAPLVKAKVRLFIVSADDSIRKMLQRLPNSEPVMRRIRAIPEVSSFTDDEATKFIEKGFEDKLGLEISQKNRFLGACRAATDLKPDYLHDYCLRVAESLETGQTKVTASTIKLADDQWSKTRLAPYIERVASYMNQDDGGKNVRDKVLYSLALVPGSQGMSARNVHDLVKEQFGGFQVKNNAITRALNQLSARTSDKAEPILRKIDVGNAPMFSFLGPMEKVACRFMLERRQEDVIRVY